MQLKTIFNRVTNYKPFVVEHVELIEHESQPTLEITMRARENRVPMVPCWLGSPDELEGGGHMLWSELGPRVQLGKTGGFLGIIAPQPG